MEVIWIEPIRNAIANLDKICALLKAGEPTMSTNTTKIALHRLQYLVKYDQHILRSRKDGLEETELEPTDAGFLEEWIDEEGTNICFAVGMQLEETIESDEEHEFVCNPFGGMHP